ncbi:hypothetical protein ACQRIT_001666 [Beauveria bassiana]
MTGEAEYEIRVMRDITTIHVGAVGVTSAPRSYDFTNLTLSSDESDAAATTDSPTTKKRHWCESNCQALEESSFDMPTSKPRGISIDDICSSRSARATSIDKNNASAEDESSFDMPISEPRATSVEDTCSPETTQAPSPLFHKCNANAENEPPKNNVAVAVLRRTHVSNKRKLDESSDKTDSAVVNQHTRAPRQFAAIRGQPKRFDSDAFDAMIYCQSETQPPPGLAISRPPMTSSAGPAATNAFPHDDRVFVSANPAIHGTVERSDKWWKDKTLEIRKRPSRKQWFGKPAERMRWLCTTQQQEEAKRRAQPRGRQTRQDPLSASYKRVMDFGDVSEDQLPTDVRNNSGWARACAWMRSMREEDAALHRGVEYRTQRAWQHYQDILREAEE